MYNNNKDNNSSISNKKAGKGNGNSIISYKSTDANTKDYVSGDIPSSSSHKLSKDSQSKGKN